jgi:hypothetical protein
MALVDQAALAADATFRSKVRVAAVQAALAVQGETPTQHATVDAKRAALAAAILQDGGAVKLDAFAWSVASNVAISGSSTDSDIQFTINSVFSDLAGATGGELGGA